MRKSVLVVVGCLVLSAAPAWAGGAFHLFGTYGEVTNGDRMFGAGVRGSLGSDQFVVDLTATWYPEHGATPVSENGFEIDDDLQMIPFDLGLRWVFSPTSELRPYIGAGATYVMLNVGRGDVDDEAGFYGLAGFIVQFGGDGGFFAEAIYRAVEATFVYEGIEYEQDVGGLAASVGVFWAF